MPKQKLSVRPLKRAYQPKYPSYFDPNPIDHPETRPYPFSHKMIDTLGKAGFVGALLLSPMALDAQTTEVPSENPFLSNRTHLPFVPISYGTGQPSRLSREDVIDFIHQAFVKEGLHPKRNQLVTADSMRITVDSYDESCNIGFVWLDYSNFGDGMRRESPYGWESTALSQDQKRIQILKILENEYKSYQRDSVQYVSRLIASYRNKPVDQDLKRDYEEVLPTLATVEEQKAYFIERLADYYYLDQLEKYRVLAGFDSYFTLLETIGADLPDSIEKYALSWRTNTLANFLNNQEELGKAMAAELRRVVALPTAQERREAIEWLLTYANLDSYRRYINRDPAMEQAFAAVLTADTAKERRRKYELLTVMIDEREVSLAEVRKLDEVAAEGEQYIAPISVFDNRSIYQTSYSYKIPVEVQQQLDELKEKLDNASSEEERNALREEYYELRAQVNNERIELRKLKALKQLAEEVRNYIRWAKAQQGY